jgi:hypothetical protein
MVQVGLKGESAHLFHCTCRLKSWKMQQSFKINIEIDGLLINMEAANLEQTNAALMLSRQFTTTHPSTAKQVSPIISTVKAHGQITHPPQQKQDHR